MILDRKHATKAESSVCRFVYLDLTKFLAQYSDQYSKRGNWANTKYYCYTKLNLNAIYLESCRHEIMERE